jgi:hypothetical protein
METPIIGTQTLTTLMELVKCWNKESVAYDASLIITRNRTVIMKDMEILLSLEFPLEDTEDNGNNVPSTSLPELEADYPTFPNEITSPNLDETLAFDNNNIEFNISNEEILEDPEIIPGPAANENNETTLETVDTAQDQSTTINGIINDLTEEKVNPPFRAIPLLTFSWKDKVNEIIGRLKGEIRGSKREKQVRTLETCYYLGIILNEFQNNSKISNEIRRLMKDSLGSHKMYNFWKGAHRINQVLQPQELPRLYQTQFITLSNMNRLYTENFGRLIELRTNGVSS